MAAQTLEVHQIGEEFYVTVREAARYLDVAYTRVFDLIYVGRLPAVQIESRWMIESETLRAFEIEYRRV